MAAIRPLVLRGLLAGRRVAMATPHAFSTTTTTTTIAGSHLPQSHQPSYESVMREYARAKLKHLHVSAAAAALVFAGVSGLLGPFTTPDPSFRSLLQDGMSKAG